MKYIRKGEETPEAEYLQVMKQNEAILEMTYENVGGLWTCFKGTVKNQLNYTIIKQKWMRMPDVRVKLLFTT